MNIQINLLPEAKLAKMRNKSRRSFYLYIALASAGAVAAASVAFIMLYVFLIGTFSAGEQRLKDLKQEISKNAALEESASTLQDNLAAFYSLNSSRTYSSRIFYNLYKAVPSNISISSVGVSSENILSISATTDNFLNVAKFANSLALYNVDYLPQEGLERKPIFSDVNITSISKSQEGSVSFSLTTKVDQNILKNQVTK